MDTPWLYVYSSHKLSQPTPRTLQLTSELTARKWLTIRNLVLDALYRDRGREKEARLDIYTPAVTYLKVSTTITTVTHIKAAIYKIDFLSPNYSNDLPTTTAGRRY